jgi:chemotaxis protein MotA
MIGAIPAAAIRHGLCLLLAHANTLMPVVNAMKWFIDTRKSTLLGLVGGVSILVAMAYIARPGFIALFNLPGLIMVLGGTLAATLVSRPLRDVVKTIRSLPKLMHDEHVRIDAEIPHLLDIAYWYRAGNIEAAEQAIAEVNNPLLRIGAQLVIDQEPIHDIVKVLQWRIAGIRDQEQSEAHILRIMATFAPAFGMLGTLFGLVQMLNGLGQTSLSQVGVTMSFALITTLYGLVLANVVFKPLAMKMERRIQQRIMGMNFILEGVVLLHQRRHPIVIKESLEIYLSQLQGNSQVPVSLARAA